MSARWNKALDSLSVFVVPELSYKCAKIMNCDAVKAGERLRRIPLSKRSHVIGFQPLATGTAEHESALERDFVTLTSFLDPGASITSQPITLRFHDGRKCRRYTPDFLIRFSNGRSELIEVKYRTDLRLHWQRLKPGFLAARAWALEHGARFRIATERAIRGALLENAKRLLPLRRAPIDTDAAEWVLAAAGARPSLPLSEILATCPFDRPVALATLWRLIARGGLRVDLAAPITLNTPVSLP